MQTTTRRVGNLQIYREAVIQRAIIKVNHDSYAASHEFAAAIKTNIGTAPGEDTLPYSFLNPL